MEICQDCNGKQYVELFTSSVPCYCVDKDYRMAPKWLRNNENIKLIWAITPESDRCSHVLKAKDLFDKNCCIKKEIKFLDVETCDGTAYKAFVFSNEGVIGRLNVIPLESSILILEGSTLITKN